jgi:hypothetical protein
MILSGQAAESCRSAARGWHVPRGPRSPGPAGVVPSADLGSGVGTRWAHLGSTAPDDSVWVRTGAEA